MNIQDDLLPYETIPVFLKQAEGLKAYLKKQDRDTLQKIWKCNDKITDLNVERLKKMDLNKGLTPAVLSYEGLQYQHMAPAVFDVGQWNYIKEYLYIVSGFYGLLRAADGIVPYRLEMQANVNISFEGAIYKSLYAFWKDSLVKKLSEKEQLIINLASKEYSKAVEKYIPQNITYITCKFVTLGKDKKGETKLMTKGTEAKMARGEMVRFMAERNITKAEELKKFNRLGYGYKEALSDSLTYTFMKE